MQQCSGTHAEEELGAGEAITQSVLDAGCPDGIEAR